MEKADNTQNIFKNQVDAEASQYVKKKKSYLVGKRIIDVVFSLILSFLLIPVFLLLALIIKLDSPGKVVFSQLRTGKDGKVFKMYKFRSMSENAESKRKILLKHNKMDGPVFKVINDPRVTRVGKVIRKTSLDELPQLFNILMGDMSIVGPRPLVTYETKDFNSYQNIRHKVKPGLTCYWQIGGRNEISFEEWMALDVKYVKEMSLKTDAYILFKTIKVVLLGIGAY